MPIIHHILSRISSLGKTELWTSSQFLNYKPFTDPFPLISEKSAPKGDKTHEFLHEFDDPLPLQQVCGLKKEAEQSVPKHQLRLARQSAGKALASVEQDAGVKTCEIGRGDGKGRKAADAVGVHGPTITNGSGQSSFG